MPSFVYIWNLECASSDSISIIALSTIIETVILVSLKQKKIILLISLNIDKLCIELTEAGNANEHTANNVF